METKDLLICFQGICLKGAAQNCRASSNGSSFSSPFGQRQRKSRQRTALHASTAYAFGTVWSFTLAPIASRDAPNILQVAGLQRSSMTQSVPLSSLIEKPSIIDGIITRLQKWWDVHGIPLACRIRHILCLAVFPVPGIPSRLVPVHYCADHGWSDG